MNLNITLVELFAAAQRIALEKKRVLTAVMSPDEQGGHKWVVKFGGDRAFEAPNLHVALLKAIAAAQSPSTPLPVVCSNPTIAQAG
jgi:hypothetical protein